MNVLFLTLVEINSIEERGIYQDLLRKFRDEGHSVTIVTPVERRKKKSTTLEMKDGVKILRVKTLNIQKTNIIEKGLGTLAIEFQYLFAIKKYLKDEKFDIVLYSTPPITLVKPVEYIKKRDNAYTYLLLKDIFPQNAVDLAMMKEDGFLHRYFVKKEKKLYNLSDKIGCMSPANVKYVLKHNPQVLPSKVEVNPNSIEPVEFVLSQQQRETVRKKYDLPIDKTIFVYGGNLGKPQGVEFLLDTISSNSDNDTYFLIVGSGTEFSKIENWFLENKPQNAKLLEFIPKSDYDTLLASCDVGLIFLHKNFTIPNFPSRLLSYLEFELPIIAATDPNTDIGTEIERNKCGISVISGDKDKMSEAISIFCKMQNEDLLILKQNCRNYLKKEFMVRDSYEKIVNKLQ